MLLPCSRRTSSSSQSTGEPRHSTLARTFAPRHCPGRDSRPSQGCPPFVRGKEHRGKGGGNTGWENGTRHDTTRHDNKKVRRQKPDPLRQVKLTLSLSVPWPWQEADFVKVGMMDTPKRSTASASTSVVEFGHCGSPWEEFCLDFPLPVRLGPVQFRTAEHAVQAHKFPPTSAEFDAARLAPSQSLSTAPISWSIPNNFYPPSASLAHTSYSLYGIELILTYVVLTVWD